MEFLKQYVLIFGISGTLRVRWKFSKLPLMPYRKLQQCFLDEKAQVITRVFQEHHNA